MGVCFRKRRILGALLFFFFFRGFAKEGRAFIVRHCRRAAVPAR